MSLRASQKAQNFRRSLHHPARSHVTALRLAANTADGNVYIYLCEPLGHRYLLDARIEMNDIGRAILCGWNVESLPFSTCDAEACLLVQAEIINAIAGEHPNEVGWRGFCNHPAHFITHMEGARLLAVDKVAIAIRYYSCLRSIWHQQKRPAT